MGAHPYLHSLVGKALYYRRTPPPTGHLLKTGALLQTDAGSERAPTYTCLIC